MHSVTIRPPTILRVYVAVFLVIWIALVVANGWGGHQPEAAVIAVVLVGFGLTIGIRLLLLGVTTQEDGSLRIRNNFGSRTISQGGRIGQTTVHALLTDGTLYAIDVTTTLFGFLAGRQQRQLEQLRAWRRG